MGDGYNASIGKLLSILGYLVTFLLGLLVVGGGGNLLDAVILSALGGWLILLAVFGIASVSVAYVQGDEPVPRFFRCPWAGLSGLSAGVGLGFLVVIEWMRNGALNDRLALLIPGAALAILAGGATIVQWRRKKR